MYGYGCMYVCMYVCMQGYLFPLSNPVCEQVIDIPLGVYVSKGHTPRVSLVGGYLHLLREISDDLHVNLGEYLRAGAMAICMRAAAHGRKLTDAEYVFA